MLAGADVDYTNLQIFWLALFTASEIQVVSPVFGKSFAYTVGGKFLGYGFAVVLEYPVIYVIRRKPGKTVIRKFGNEIAFDPVAKPVRITLSESKSA